MSKTNKQEDSKLGASQETPDSLNSEKKDHGSTGYRGKKGKRHKKGTRGEGGSGPKEDGIPWKNDWSFYAASERIAKDIASVPFNYLNGTKFPLDVTLHQTNLQPIPCPTVPLPGVLVLKYVPSVGINNRRTDGINMAAAQLYSYVRHANSGARNYEAADMMMYILALKDIYTEYFECKRIIGLSRLYNYYNHNYPDLLITALGVNPSDLRANLSQYRGQLNLIAEKINTFAIPKYFKAFDRSAYISSYVFSDSTSIRGQVYAFKSGGYYKWSGTTSTAGTELKFTAHSNQLVNFSVRLQILEDMLDAIYLDEDALTMSGDILKAFSEPSLYVVRDTDEKYAVVPVMDNDILAQIENAVFLNDRTLYDSVVSVFDLDIKQENQLIKWNPYATYTVDETFYTYFEFHNRAFNSHKDDPTYTDVLEWSRLMITFDKSVEQTDTNTTYKNTVTSCGLELPVYMQIFSYNSSGEVISKIVTQTIVASINTDARDKYPMIADLTQFDWHPMLYVVDNIHSAENERFHTHVLGDLQVTTTIDNNIIKAMNDSACYSAFFARDLYNSTK